MDVIVLSCKLVLTCQAPENQVEPGRACLDFSVGFDTSLV